MKTNQTRFTLYEAGLIILFVLLYNLYCDKNPEEPQKTKAPVFTGTVTDNSGSPLQGVGVHFLYGDYTNILYKNKTGIVNNAITINDTGIVSVTGPDSNRLYQNYPNPSNGLTTIAFDLVTTGDICVAILNWPDYDTIRTMSYSLRFVGHYNIQWDGKNSQGVDVTNGFYTIRLTAGDWIDEKTICIQNPDCGMLKASKTYFNTNSNGEFEIDYKNIPVGKVIPLTNESSPEIIDTFTIPDSVTIILTKPGYTAVTQKVLIDTTCYVNMKFTLASKP